jgi:SNF2 family DNA or RNA helicase
MSRQWLMGLTDEYQALKIWVKLDGYDPGLNKELKARLPGPAIWNGEHKFWVFPAHWDTCVKARELANRFDATIKISPALNEWALKEKARQETIPDVQSMELVDLPCIREQHPRIWEAITQRPFQSVGAAFAARNRSCLIADQPGLGKTIQSIAAIIEANITGPILVVAPKNAAKLTWTEELEKWVPWEEVIVIGAHIAPEERGYTVDRAMEILEESATSDLRRTWFITSPNYVRMKAEIDQFGNYVKKNGQKQFKMVQEGLKEFFDYEWSAIIIDESHQTIAGGSGNKKKWSAQKQGLGALTVRENGLRLALSGTPFRGKEEYLWGQLNWLKPELFRSYWRWINDHFDAHQDRYGMVIGNIIDMDKMYKEASTVMIRRTKAEVAADLPEKIYNVIWLDMEAKQARAYEEIERKAQAELEGGILQTVGILSELTRLKQFAGSYGRMDGDTFMPTLPSNKYEWLLEFLDERGIDKSMAPDYRHAPASVPKIVVASQFSKLIDTFAAGLAKEGILTHKFTGDTPDKKREEIKDDFQNNATSPVRVLLLTTTAGGVSLTLDAADEMVILDETWNTSDQEQVEDRLHRLSRIHQVTIWKVFSRGTIEEHIFKANAEAEFNIKSVMDGARGVEVAKRLLNT